MTQSDTINTNEDYINYTFNIESRGITELSGELLGLSSTVSSTLGLLAFKTSELLSHTEMLAVGTSAAIGAMFVSATQSAVRFEQQMANVKAIGGESLNVQEIGNAAMEYSNKFGMATASMTEGLEALARAGITTTSVMKSVLEEGVKLSKLEGMDLEDSINDLIATTNLLSVDNVNMNDAQYADMVKEMNQHIVSTSESAPINAQNIIQSLQHVGGYASASGMDQDDLFAVIAQLGSRGTKGEMAGTALRAFIAAGQKDTAQRALARIGLNVRDLWNENGETMLSISEMKDVLDEALENRGYSKQEKLEFYSDFAGYKQANQIMKIDTSEVQQYKEKIANAWDLGTKLNTILNTVRGNLDRIRQITQNFMTKVGGKILFIANAVLTPVRMILEFMTNIPFADTAVAAGMIFVGFNGILKIINNIVPRFANFFTQLSRVKSDMFDIRNVWRKMPDDIAKAKDTIKAVSNPQEMLDIQRERQLYSNKQIQEIENKIAPLLYVQANWNDPRLSGMSDGEKRAHLEQVYYKKDNIFHQSYINELKTNDPEKWEKMIETYIQKTTSHAHEIASGSFYDVGDVLSYNDTLLDIDKYITWIWGLMSEQSDNGTETDSHDKPRGKKDNRERNAEERQARAQARKDAFRERGNRILNNRSEYGDYSYRVTVPEMKQFQYNDINAMKAFERKVMDEIRRKEEMYANFFDNRNIEAGRNRLKKSLTVAAKTDLGYEFSTGANTSDIKHILETGNIRSGSSHILTEQLQTIADILETNTTGDTNADMQRFHRILSTKTNKQELLDSILSKTQNQWNDKYYNNGRVGYFPTQALKMASNGETARKIMEKVGVNSIEEVQRHFKTVALDDTLLNECVDIMYEDKELVAKLVNEEIKYMYENLARVQNSIRAKEDIGSGFHSEGEQEYETNLQKARDYILNDFNLNDFEHFSASPNGKNFTVQDIIMSQGDRLLTDVNQEHLEGFQGFIYPIGGDIVRSQRYGNDNFKIRNIKHIPYNDLLDENVAEVFLDRGDEDRFDFMEVFADWVYEMASYENNFWENSFGYNYYMKYARENLAHPDFAIGESRFNELKQEFEEIYRAYIDIAERGAQSFIESSSLYGPTVTYRGGRLYTPVNDFGSFDTITSTSLLWDSAKQFWNKNPYQREIMELYNPANIQGVLAYTDVLNNQNEHLWSRERELTLGKDQPYLHIPNPDGMEKRLLMLTLDQQKAVRDIMGENFEFKPNTFESRITREYLEETSKKMHEGGFLSAGESFSSNILKNQLSPILNKDNLTTENMGEKLRDLLVNGSILVDTKYRGGSLGATNKDDTIDINTGTIKYHSDNYNEQYGNYGKSLLDTVLHEMTHILMMHKERQNYQNNEVPSTLGIDNFEIPQLLHGYDSNFVAEYEALYVSSKVLNRLGLEANKKNEQRMAAFEELIEHKGYGDQIQYELLDQLVEDMLDNISVIGDITESLSTQFDMQAAGVTSAQISEDMRPILQKIQVFNKDSTLYKGSQGDSKKDEIEQVLSDMEKDMEFLWDSGISDKEMIYNMVAQKYATYIETLEGVNLNQFLKHAAPNFKKRQKITPNAIAKMFIDDNTDKYTQQLITDDLKEVLKPIIQEEKETDPNKKLRKSLSGFKEVPLDNFSMLLPLHSAPPVLNADGSYAQGYMNKFIFNRGKGEDGPLGIRNILDSDLVQGLDLKQKVEIAKAILEEEMYSSVSDLMSVDKKLSGAIGWLVINTDTGVTCMNRMTDGICEFADACYAFMGTMRPAGLKKQLEKMIFYSELGPEELADEVRQRNGRVVRINQEGEFNSIKDFLKISKIAELLPDVQFYGYTKNQDVLKEIATNGLPKNLTINDSLGQTNGPHYLSVPEHEIIDYLEKGYVLCKGACAECEQCLKDMKKVTILRDGSQTVGVEDVAHLSRKEQKEFFRALKEEYIKDNSSAFASKGEDRLPELADYYPIDNSYRDEKYIESLGYGGLDRNIMDFLSDVDDTFIWHDNYKREKGGRTLPDDHWGTRSIINHGYFDIGTQTARLLNYGLYYNRKTTSEAKSTGIEEIVNLFNKDAAKKAFMQGIVSDNQLKKWNKQLQGSKAVDEYGEVPWSIEDVKEWKKEKDESDKKLKEKMEERRKKIQEMIEAQNEISIPTLSVIALMPANTQTKPDEFGMPELVENFEYIAYMNFKNKERERIKEMERNAKQIGDAYKSFYESEEFIIQERNEAIWDSYKHIKDLQTRHMGVGVGIGNHTEQKSDNEEDNISYILDTLRTKYTKNVYEEMSGFDKARYKLSKDGKNHRIMNKGIDIAEKISTGVKNRIANNSDDDIQQTDIFGESANKIETLVQPLEDFTSLLESLSDVFPVLIPSVILFNKGLSIASGVIEALNVIQAYNNAVTGANTTAKTLNTMAEEGNTAATYLNTISKWANTASEGTLKQLIGRVFNKGMNFLGKTLTSIGEMSVTTAATIALPILAIIAAIEAIKFWENQHAEALKKSQKELEEATAKNNIAISQYKDLKKARENETDAIKKQKAARKEAIALYELEAARINKQKAVREESKLRNDGVWGEYGLRAEYQKMDWAQAYVTTGGIGVIAKMLSGDFEPQYQNYEGTTSNIRQIRESQVGKMFKGTAEQEYVSKVYDKNSMFFSQVEAYQDPLHELYDKETRLIDQYGSVDAARGSKEFADAVKEFSDATGINGKTAGMMLDWLETENRVSQATKIGQAEIGMIQARTQAKVMAIDAEGENGLGDMNNLGDAMIVAQFQEMMNTAKTEMWWDLLFAYMNLILSALSPWDWFTGETAKNQKKVAAYQEGLNELDAQGNQILKDMLENETEREDYGNGGLSLYGDTPFGAALENAGMSTQQSMVGNTTVNASNLSIDTSKVYDDFQESVKKPEKNNAPNLSTNQPQNTPSSSGKTSQNVIHIHNININTEDDPEKIKSALMNLIIEMQEQVVPRTVARTIGQSPAQSNTTTQNLNNTTESEGVDPQSGINNNTNNNTNNNNTNPTT